MPNSPDIYDNRTLLHMLDLTYELEGLLQLMLNRDDDSLQHLAALAEGKIRAISAQLPSLLPSCEKTPAEDAGAATAVAESAENADYTTEYEVDAVSVVPEENTDYMADEEEAVPDEDTGYAGGTEDAEPDDNEEYAIAEEDTGETEDEYSETNAPVHIEKAAEGSAENAPVRHQGSRMTPVFSINDRFLYARELFGGRVADFESSLKEVAGMDSYEEAEEYFLTEWAFDPESPSVKSFMTVIESYFS